VKTVTLILFIGIIFINYIAASQEILISCGGSSNEFGTVIIGCPIGNQETGTFFGAIQKSIGEKMMAFGVPEQVIKKDYFIYLIIGGISLLFISLLFIIYKIKKR